MTKRLLLLLTFLQVVLGGGKLWAQSEWSHDRQKNTLSVTTAKGSSNVSSYTGYSISYGGGTYTSAVKMESATTITFTTTATSKVTIGIALKDGKSYEATKATVKLDGVLSASAISSATIGAKSEVGVDVTFNNVAAGEHIISRGNDELGVFYIKVESIGTVTAEYVQSVNPVVKYDFSGQTLYAYSWGAFDVKLTASAGGTLNVSSNDESNALSTLSSTSIASGNNLTITPRGTEGTEVLTITATDGSSTTLTIVYKTGVESYPHTWTFNTAWTDYADEIGSGTAYWVLSGNHYYNGAVYGTPGSNLLIGGTGTKAVTQTYGLTFTGIANRIWTQSVDGGTSYLAVGDGGTITIPNVPAGYTVALNVFKTTGTPTINISSPNGVINNSLVYNTNTSNTYSITGEQGTPQTIYVTAPVNGDITLKINSTFVYFNSISVTNMSATDETSGNTYTVTGAGQLNKQTVSSVSGITMEYGSNGENQYVRTLSGQNGYYAYCVKSTGDTNTDIAADAGGLPSTGSFYKFTFDALGTLVVRGIVTDPSGSANNVYIVNSGGVSQTITQLDNTITFTPENTGDYYLYARGNSTFNLQSFTFTLTSKYQTITIDDMKISKNVSINGLSASNNLDRTLGGFNFAFIGDDGVKFQNQDYLQLRYNGKITITPQNSSTGTISITRVDISTYAGYNGSVKVNDASESVTINNVTSYSFTDLSNNTFTLESTGGDGNNVLIKSFTIYYTENDGAVLNTAKITPTITFSKTADEVTTTEDYTSPKVTTNPAYFDISIVSNNTDVATVADKNWTEGIVSLTGNNGTAVVTASSTANDYYNAATDATYSVAMNNSSSKKWDFTSRNDADYEADSHWSKSGDYYSNIALTTENYSTTNTYADYEPSFTQLKDLKFARYDNSGLKAGCIRVYDGYLTYNNTNVIIAVPVEAGQSVIVTFSDGTYTFENATLDDDEIATSITASSTKTEATLIATNSGYVHLINSSKAKLYSIELKNETRQALTLRDNGSNTYNRNTGSNFSHRVTFSPSGSLTAEDASLLHITSSDASVVNTSSAKVRASGFGESSSFYFDGITPVSAGSATLTVTFNGNENYKPFTYETHTYNIYGAISSFKVVAEDQEIQRGQMSVIRPVITNAAGEALGFTETSTDVWSTYVLGEEEDIPDYTEYIDFSYSVSSTGTGENWNVIDVQEDNNDGVGHVTTEQTVGSTTTTAEPGASRQVTITATPKSTYSSAFGPSATANSTITLTIVPKTQDPQIELYWDAACTDAHKITGLSSEDRWIIIDTEAKKNSESQWQFGSAESGLTTTKYASGFPNGKMIYAKAKNEGDSIWFSYGQNAEAKTIPSNPKLDKNNRVFEYRHGVPIYYDTENDAAMTARENYVTLNIVATSWDATTKKRKLNGTVVRMKFFLVDVDHTRPDRPTYDPVSPDPDDAVKNKETKGKSRRIMNTSENVVAYGEGASKGVTGNNNLVFGKFSTETVYKTEQLVNERTVTYRVDNVPVVSTEVAERRFTSVQIRTVANKETLGYGEYISRQTYTEYYYLYDTDLTLTPNTNFYINIGETQAAPSYKVTWYNKRNYKNEKATGVTQEVDSYDGKMSFAITDTNGATGTTIDTSTGLVTAGSSAGWVKVMVTYNGGEEHGGKSGEPQYTSTTDKSTASYYVYISDPTKEQPLITPPTRKFTSTLTYTIQAPPTWNVYYKAFDNTESGDVSNVSGNYDGTLEPGQSISFTIGSGMAKDNYKVVKAIAYNGDASSNSGVFYEKYTKKDPLPDPVFDPDGVPSPYRYNTSTLTVQIACAYAGSVIYYTTDGSDPVIGATNTYKYSGLSKVVISGNVTIKAIAYDPEDDIYSHVVASRYIYSDVMDQPYFQISNDGGLTWYGMVGSTLTIDGKEWYDGQSETITPTTQIRIVDPNPTAGTIFYTVNGTMPSDDTNSLIYSEGYPFTVAKTTTANAITILESASSDLATAVFNIESSSYDVWEAVNETLTVPSGKTAHGIYDEDGYVISTKKDLYVKNSKTTVNLHSIATADGGSASKTYAQKYITATFGGFKAIKNEEERNSNEWTEMTIADAAIGAPIDGVGQYSIKGLENAQMEDKSTNLTTNTWNYNHVNSYVPTSVHEKTFKVPARGTYVRFEPEKDGDLTIWVLQQGAVHYEEDEYFIDRYIRMKPVYMVDEQGKSYQVKTVNGVPQLWSSARLSTNWTKLQATAAENGGAGGWANYDREDPNDNTKKVGDYIYLDYTTGAVTTTAPAEYNTTNYGEKKSDGKRYKRMENKGPNRTESQTLYNLYKSYIDNNHVSVGDPIKPFAIHTGTAISQNNGNYSDNSNDGTGYVLVSGGYAKYTFEVKAGKTYFFFATGSKIGVRGFQFVPTETEKRPKVTINDDQTTIAVEGGKSEGYTPSELKTYCAGKTVDVTLNRAFHQGKWASLVLPFSVSTTQLEQLFGDGTEANRPEVVHYKDIKSPNTLVFRHHKHQMVVAGTPVILYPGKELTSVKFEGVQIEADVVETMTGLERDDYSLIGSFVKTADDGEVSLHRYDYYFGNADGKLYRFNSSNPETNTKSIKAARAWLRPKTPDASRLLTLAFIGDEDDVDDGGSTTGIIEIADDMTYGNEGTNNKRSGAVYNLKGQKVSDDSLEDLPKGVYIVNGKKVVVE